LTLVALAHARIILESRNVLQTLLRDVTALDQADMARLIPELSNKIPAAFASILKDGIAAGQVRAVPARRTGILLMGMVNAMAVRRLYAEVETTLEQDVGLVVDVLLEGIALRPNPMEAVNHD